MHHKRRPYPPLLLRIGMLWVWVLLFLGNGFAQTNLVPNPSFEQYTNCPSAINLNAIKNSKPDLWYKPDKRGAGYLNSCADTFSGVPIHYNAGGKDFQYARSGEGYVGMFYRNGIIDDQRNYFQVRLIDSLRAGKCYYAECYVNLPGTFEMVCNNQSILLTSNVVYADSVPSPREIILANPQVTNYYNKVITDTLNWIKVSGVFVAQGGEQYLTLGNFRNNSNTKYVRFLPAGSGYEGAAYYIDDVSVIPLDSFPLKADAGPDTTIALGDSVFIGSLTNGIPNIKWYDMASNVIDTGRPGFVVHPTTTTSYIIEQTVCGYYSRDTVTVSVNLLPLKWLSVELTAVDLTPAPLPRIESGQARRGVSIRWRTASEVNVRHYNVQRSLRGTDAFENIGQLPAHNQPDNAYSFVDNTLPAGFTGRVLYRIQSIDKDDSRSYSSIRSWLVTGKQDNPIIYPNPAQGVVNIQYPNITMVTITDALGREVAQQAGFGRGNVQVNIHHLPAGLYAVRVVSGDKVLTEKLIKE